LVKSGSTSFIEFVGENLPEALDFALSRKALNIFIKSGQYDVSSNILIENFSNLRIVSDGAQLRFNGGAIVIRGENYENSMNNFIEGLIVINGSIIIENSFMTTISKCIFKNSDIGIAILNTNTWTECTSIEDCYFENVRRCIVFKTPGTHGTRSYANTEIKRCNFKLTKEESIAIHVEVGTDFNEGTVQNARIWMGGGPQGNYQIGILIEGSMLNTLLQNVVFESFAHSPNEIYGIKIGKLGEPPIIGQGVVFLGNLTRNIDNPFGKWLYGIGSCFKFENISVPLGLNDSYGELCKITPPKWLYFSISGLQLKITVEGKPSENETLTVRLRLKFMDDSYSKDLTKTFNTEGSMWLDYDDFLSIWPSVNIISSLMLDAKTNELSSNVRVYVSVYGQFN
jgi:hypothetical protein